MRNSYLRGYNQYYVLKPLGILRLGEVLFSETEYICAGAYLCKILKDPWEILVWGCFKEQVSAASLSNFLSTWASSIFCCLVWHNRKSSFNSQSTPSNFITLLALMCWSVLPDRELCLGCWEETTPCCMGNDLCCMAPRQEVLHLLSQNLFSGITKYLRTLQLLLWTVLCMPSQLLFHLASLSEA